ncbi:MAG: TonB family protein [Pontibacterium sp.]
MSLPQRPMRFSQQWALAAVLSVGLHLVLATAFVFWPEGDEGEGAHGLAGAVPYLNQAVAVQFVSLASVTPSHLAVPEVTESKLEAVIEPEPPTLPVVQDTKKATRALPVTPKSEQKNVGEKAARSTKIEQPVKVAPSVSESKPKSQLKPKPQPVLIPKATPQLVKTPVSKPKPSVEKPATVDPTLKKKLEEELAEQPASLLATGASELLPEPSIEVAKMPQATTAISQVDDQNQPDSVKTTATSKAPSSALSLSSNESANQSSNQGANQNQSPQVASTTGSTGSAGLTSPQYIHKPIKYPSRARERGQEGKLEVSVSVSALGKVTKVVLLSSSGHVLLDKAALKAVKRWRFKPAIHHGQAVAATVVVPYEFRLQ